MSVKIILALLFSITVWGGSFPVAKLALEELTPLNLAALRFTVASLLFIPVVLLVQRRRDEPGIPWPSRPDLLRLNGLAWLGVTIHFLLQYSAVARTTASNAGLIIAISPLFVVLISNFWLKEPFTWRQLVGILVASFGVAVVISRGTFQFSFGSQTLQGDLIMVVDAFFWALFSICGREMMRRLSPLITTFYVTVLGTVWFYPLALPAGLWTQVTSLSATGWLAVLFLGVFCSVGGYYCWYWALSQVEASKVAPFQYLQPMVSLALSALLLGERISPLVFVGGAVPIILGLNFLSKP
jgi:drug/metabolite transporter (DMT)-like permease